MRLACFILALAAALGIGFLLGLAVGHYEVFPFQVLYRLKNRIEMSWGLQRKWTVGFQQQLEGRLEAPCPSNSFVLVPIGQSNAANTVSSLVERRPDVSAFNFYDGHCYLIQDPLLGASGSGGSLWTGVAQGLAERNPGLPILVVAAAAGGSAVSDWLDTRSSYLPRLERQLALLQTLDFRSALFIWVQGEADATFYVPEATYAERLRKLIGRIGALPSIKVNSQWLIFQTSRCGDDSAGSAAILRAQKSVASSLPGAILGPNTDTLGSNYRYDSCHYNDDGRRTIVPQVIELIERHVKLPEQRS
jgi:Carbohydrate esterase, sialic acid-specific acetylesterase